MTLWLLARATGFVALVAFTLSIVLGASSSDPKKSRPDGRALDRRLLVQFAHRSAGVIGLAMLIGHAVLIVLDSYVSVSVTGALAPFTAGYRGLAVGLGTLAGYLFVLAALTGALRGRLASSPIAARGWRTIHGLAYIGFVLALGHGLFSGTDTGSRWTTILYTSCAAAVGIAWWLRLGRADTHSMSSLGQARTGGEQDRRIDLRGRV